MEEHIRRDLYALWNYSERRFGKAGGGKRYLLGILSCVQETLLQQRPYRSPSYRIHAATTICILFDLEAAAS